MADLRIWELLARKYNDEITAEELSELTHLLQQTENAFLLHELLSDLQGTPLKPPVSKTDVARNLESLKLMIEVDQAETLLNGSVQQQARRRYRHAFAALGGVLILLVSLYFWFFDIRRKPAGIAEAPLNEVITNGGSKSTVHLPDGSVVILNTGSKLSYNKEFGIESREIYLSGEAFFDIARDEKIPLTVHAGNVEIKVKGTVFNVKAYVEDSIVEASLIQGAIEVFSKDDKDRRILLRPNEKIVIGSSAMISSGDSAKVRSLMKENVFMLKKLEENPVDSSINEIAWIKNRLSFFKEPFSSLAVKMESWYNVSIHFEDEDLKKVTFTGSFEKEDIIEALEALRQTTSFGYNIDNRKVVIRKDN